MTAVLFFEIEASADAVGGKGASLSRLVREGLPVPRGFSVVADALHGFGAESERAVSDAVGRLGGDAFAVRSSAIGEDGASASFAGIHRSLLNVPARRVAEALGEVRASAWSEAALAYRARRGLAAEPRIAAVVQAMVLPDVSGVLFTRDPVTGADRFVVEASWGLGEAIVSGIVTPDHFELSRSGEILAERIGDKDVAIEPSGDGTIEVEVDPARRAVACVGPADLARLLELARACERIFGSPQDIEFAMAGGRLWILQSRPVTA